MYENITPVEEKSLEELSHSWQQCEGIASNYFQSFSWQSAWLSLLKHRFNLRFLRIRHNQQVKLLSSLVIGRKRYLGLVPVRAAFLNSVGHEDFDVICTEGCQPIADIENRSDYYCSFFKLNK